MLLGRQLELGRADKVDGRVLVGNKIELDRANMKGGQEAGEEADRLWRCRMLRSGAQVNSKNG